LGLLTSPRIHPQSHFFAAISSNLWLLQQNRAWSLTERFPGVHRFLFSREDFLVTYQALILQSFRKFHFVT
jgi:hypothetical protein